MKIGITGKSGSGKTYLATFLASLNPKIFVLNIDIIGHEVLQNENIKQKLISAFGSSILYHDQIDRSKLSLQVFHTKENRDTLDLITWELMKQMIDQFILFHQNDIVVLEWALLPKTEYFSTNDMNILVDVHYEVNGLEYLTFSTKVGINLKIFEDGLIVLCNDKITEDSMFVDIESLASYYETKLSPALNYLFSLGAPIPKELANIKTVYPYFIVLNQATKEDLDDLLAKTDKKQYFEFKGNNYDILRGDKYYFINNKGTSLDQVERYIEEQIFIREFKGQLHHYLNLHRIIWEKISVVKENSKIRGKEIVEFTSKVEGYAKTINLVEARINQMSTYLKTREKIAKGDEGLNEFLNMIGYRYETLGNTLAYIQQLWTMTKNYVNSAATLFRNLRQDITSKSVNSLTIVTSMGVGASMLGLFTSTKVPTFSMFGIAYFVILAIVGYSVNKLMKYISANRKYQISDADYDKNIK